MKATFFAVLCTMLIGAAGTSAPGDPTPLPTPNDIPAPLAQPSAPPPTPVDVGAEPSAKENLGAGVQVGADKPPSEEQTATQSMFEKLEQDWGDAIMHHDVDFLERTEADAYTYTGPDGKVAHKNDDLEVARAAFVQIESFTYRDINVRVYGDTAVITGATTLKGKAGEMDLSGSFRWTDVFVKQGGRWQVVASQATSISRPEPED